MGGGIELARALPDLDAARRVMRVIAAGFVRSADCRIEIRHEQIVAQNDPVLTGEAIVAELLHAWPFRSTGAKRNGNRRQRYVKRACLARACATRCITHSSVHARIN